MPLSTLRTPAATLLLSVAALLPTGCQHVVQATSSTPTVGLADDGTNTGPGVVRPVVVTQPVRYDTDDPAIWVNVQDPAKSLIIGTDKDSDGGLYVFDLQGKEVPGKSVHGLKRPNNVDLAYGLKLGGQPTDFALVTERETGKLRAFRLPDMQPLDYGNLDVFVGAPDEQRMPMGVAIYTRPTDGAMFAVVGRKTGPSKGYLAQYRLADDGQGQLTMTQVRTFGTWSGKKEIESIAVDNELGFIYYSDEGVGVRKYYADPAKGDAELALFAKIGFTEDHEGISIYKTGPKTGYILVSDQGASQFRFFPRQGTAADPNAHPELRAVKVAAHFSDGSDVTNVPLNAQFPHGLFVAMSDNKTFHYYRWEDILGKDVKAVE
ncbi:phytase [Hymenobacter sp. BT559]|uniref:phytase n=1 Tax=Hymenobacter sp. BT559 TaxID=2795729 RepID=UPI0018EA3C33|nr:phytase [Hymenobacter sp. BT559]MBJ6142227.1 phytase [Hymenobacter sp. BT559]